MIQINNLACIDDLIRESLGDFEIMQHVRSGECEVFAIKKDGQRLILKIKREGHAQKSRSSLLRRLSYAK